MKLLVTGGAGFIGANFVEYLLEQHPDYEVTVVDALTYSGDEARLAKVKDKISFVKADICDEAKMDELVAGQDMIVHFAAETHVDRSIQDPGPFLRSNILGTDILARLALKHKTKRFHHVSTDEVFGSLKLDEDTFFNEDTPYDPRSPYSASKASSDHLVRAYGETYQLPYTITNCSNNYGPYDSPFRIVPLFITNAMEDKKLPIYGDGKSVRDYLYVLDHCRAIDLVIHSDKTGQTYCVGGGAERNGIQIADTIIDKTGKSADLKTFVGDRPGHDQRYAIDASKIKRDLGWEPSVSFEEGIAKTVAWYQENESWWRPIKDRIKMAEWDKK